MSALLCLLLCWGGLSLLDANLNSIVRLIPRFEGMGINKNNGTLHQGLGTDQLVIGSIVYHIQDTDLTSADFGTPREVTRVEAQGAEFLVSSASTYNVDALFTNFGHGSGSAEFELALFAELCAATTGFAAFVLSFACDTLVSELKGEKYQCWHVTSSVDAVRIFPRSI